MVTTAGDTIETLPQGVRFHADAHASNYSRDRCRTLRHSLAMAPRSLWFSLTVSPSRPGCAKAGTCTNCMIRYCLLQGEMELIL